MALTIDQDHARFRDIVKGRIRQNLKKYISHGELMGRQGKDNVSIPVPQIDMPQFRFGDKVGHAVVFFLLAALAQASHAERRVVARLMLALLGYGLFIELVQALLPWRDFSLWDWAADGVGIALCVALAHWLRRRLGAAQRAAP